MRPETDWLENGFENGKTQLFNSGGVVKWACFQKKWSIPLKKALFIKAEVPERRTNWPFEAFRLIQSPNIRSSGMKKVYSRRLERAFNLVKHTTQRNVKQFSRNWNDNVGQW